jgi:hypothetical protein
MDALLSLQKLSLVNRVCAELKNHIGIDDKTLAEFIIDLVRRAAKLGTARASAAPPPSFREHRFPHPPFCFPSNAGAKTPIAPGVHARSRGQRRRVPS